MDSSKCLDFKLHPKLVIYCIYGLEVNENEIQKNLAQNGTDSLLSPSHLFPYVPMAHSLPSLVSGAGSNLLKSSNHSPSLCRTHSKSRSSSLARGFWFGRGALFSSPAQHGFRPRHGALRHIWISSSLTRSSNRRHQVPHFIFPYSPSSLPSLAWDILILDLDLPAT